MTEQEIVELANKLGDKARGDRGFFVPSDVVRAAVAHGLRMGADLCHEKACDARAWRQHLSQEGVAGYRGAAIYADELANDLRTKADELEAAQ